MKKVFMIAVVFAVVLSLFSITAYADGREVSNVHYVQSSYYPLATHYGYYEVPYGTLVGYGYQTSGVNVRATQAALTHIYEDIGIACNPHGVDGLFGSNTYYAIYAFQNAVGLTPDGIAGDNTFSKFVNYL